MFERLETIIGENKLRRLKDSKVLIVGLGGVGGSCFESLVRSAIGTIYVCDYDLFEKSNLNRQILCTLDTIGMSKTEVAAKKGRAINNCCNIMKINCKLSKNNLDNILPQNVDYIIDACDDVDVKIELIKFSVRNNIKIISCMGTGNKLNPSLLQITNIWKTEYDPLAKKVRQLLKKEGISHKLPVVSSKEVPIKSNSNIIGSYAPVVNIAGILLANYVINDIIK